MHSASEDPRRRNWRTKLGDPVITNACAFITAVVTVAALVGWARNALFWGLVGAAACGGAAALVVVGFIKRGRRLRAVEAENARLVVELKTRSPESPRPERGTGPDR